MKFSAVPRPPRELRRWTALALISSLNCSISVEVGSGIRDAEDGAATYDDDVEKQAKQLGLEGW